MLYLKYEIHYLQGWKGLAPLKNMKLGSVEDKCYREGKKDFKLGRNHQYIPNSIHGWACKKCGGDVTAYALSWDCEHSFNCYTCNSFSVIHGGRGTISVIPNHLDEVCLYIDTFHKNNPKTTN